MTLQSNTVLSTDTSHPSIKVIAILSPFDKEKLDKEKGNWTTWHANMYSILCLSGTWDYLTGNSTQPDQTTKPTAYENWAKNDRRACGFIFGAVSEAERKAITPLESDAKKYWGLLEACHKSDGPVAQVYLIKEAMKIQARSGESFTKGVDQIYDLIDRAWAMDVNGVTLDMFKAIVVLNFFGKDFQDIQFSIQDCLKLSTKATPFTPKELWDFVKDKQHLITANTDTPTSSIALAAQSLKAHGNTEFCNNCKQKFHTECYCIKPGGGMEGKTIKESQEKKHADREAAKGKGGGNANQTTRPKVKVPFTDSNGPAFIVEVDASAITAAPATAPSAVPPFLGLAAVNTDNSTISMEFFENNT